MVMWSLSSLPDTSSRYSVLAITPATLLSYPNLTIQNIDRGRCDKMALPLQLIPRLARFSFFSWYWVDLDWVYKNIKTVVRKDVWGQKTIPTQRHEVSHAFDNGCSESTNCNRRPCQSKENSRCKPGQLWFRRPSDMSIKLPPRVFGKVVGLMVPITTIIATS